MRAVLAFLLASLALVALGQRDPSADQYSLDCHNADLRHTLDGLFHKADLSYSMDPRIAGRVSAHLPKMTWHKLMMAFLGASHLTYRVEGGIFQVIQKEEAADDPSWLAASQLDPNSPLGPADPKRRAIHARGEDVAELLWKVLVGTGQPFVIGRDIRGTVTADYPEQRIGKTLVEIALRVHGGLTYRDGTWTVLGPRPKPLGPWGSPPP